MLAKVRIGHVMLDRAFCLCYLRVGKQDGPIYTTINKILFTGQPQVMLCLGRVALLLILVCGVVSRQVSGDESDSLLAKQKRTRVKYFQVNRPTSSTIRTTKRVKRINRLSRHLKEDEIDSNPELRNGTTTEPVSGEASNSTAPEVDIQNKDRPGKRS